jgi:hypothetical protein
MLSPKNQSLFELITLRRGEGIALTFLRDEKAKEAKERKYAGRSM